MSGILTAIQRTGRCMLLICQDFIGLVILDKKHLPPVLSADGNFDSLADDVIYDVLVGANQELYLLVRRTNESQIESETTYDSGVIKYVPANK